MGSIDIDIIRTLIHTRLQSVFERWSGGDPSNYGDLFLDGASYADPWSSGHLVGPKAIHRHLAQIGERIVKPRFRIVDPRYEFSGLTATVSFDVQTWTAAGEEAPRLKATHVYGFADVDWRIMHAHWSPAAR